MVELNANQHGFGGTRRRRRRRRRKMEMMVRIDEGINKDYTKEQRLNDKVKKMNRAEY